MKIKIFILIMLCIIPYASADDAIYIISGNTVIKQGEFRVIALDKITSDLMIDSTQIYFFTKNHEYIVNSSSGEIKYKIQINNISEQKQTDTYLVLKTLNSVYKVRKDNGSIETRNKYNFGLDGIYSLFGIGGNGAQGNSTEIVVLGNIIDLGVGGTGDRLFDTVYTNTNAYPIVVFVSIEAVNNNVDNIRKLGVQLNYEGIVIGAHSGLSLPDDSIQLSVPGIIPVGGNYSVYTWNDIDYYYSCMGWYEWPLLIN